MAYRHMRMCSVCKMQCFTDRMYDAVDQIDYASGLKCTLYTVCIACRNEVYIHNAIYQELSTFFNAHSSLWTHLQSEHMCKEGA